MMRFEVGLSFGGVAERIIVPFDAVTAFFDPAVQFGLQFEVRDVMRGGRCRHAKDEEPACGTATDASEKTDPLPAQEQPPAEPKSDDTGGGAEVVRLDRFRKK